METRRMEMIHSIFLLLLSTAFFKDSQARHLSNTKLSKCRDLRSCENSCFLKGLAGGFCYNKECICFDEETSQRVDNEGGADFGIAEKSGDHKKYRKPFFVRKKRQPQAFLGPQLPPPTNNLDYGRYIGNNYSPPKDYMLYPEFGSGVGQQQKGQAPPTAPLMPYPYPFPNPHPIGPPTLSNTNQAPPAPVPFEQYAYAPQSNSYPGPYGVPPPTVPAYPGYGTYEAPPPPVNFGYGQIPQIPQQQYTPSPYPSTLYGASPAPVDNRIAPVPEIKGTTYDPDSHVSTVPFYTKPQPGSQSIPNPYGNQALNANPYNPIAAQQLGEERRSKAISSALSKQLLSKKHVVGKLNMLVKTADGEVQGGGEVNSELEKEKALSKATAETETSFVGNAAQTMSAGPQNPGFNPQGSYDNRIPLHFGLSLNRPIDPGFVMDGPESPSSYNYDRGFDGGNLPFGYWYDRGFDGGNSPSDYRYDRGFDGGASPSGYGYDRGFDGGNSPSGPITSLYLGNPASTQMDAGFYVVPPASTPRDPGFSKERFYGRPQQSQPLDGGFIGGGIYGPPPAPEDNMIYPGVYGPRPDLLPVPYPQPYPGYYPPNPYADYGVLPDFNAVHDQPGYHDFDDSKIGTMSAEAAKETTSTKAVSKSKAKTTKVNKHTVGSLNMKVTTGSGQIEGGGVVDSKIEKEKQIAKANAEAESRHTKTAAKTTD